MYSWIISITYGKGLLFPPNFTTAIPHAGRIRTLVSAC